MSTDTTDMTVREFVTASIQPLLPESWRFDPGIPSKMHSLSAPLVWLEYTSFSPLDESPLSSVAASVDVCIATNKTDVRKGEDAADEHVSDLYEAAFASHDFYNITAEKTVFWDAYFGWRLSLTVVKTLTTKE